MNWEVMRDELAIRSWALGVEKGRSAFYFLHHSLDPFICENPWFGQLNGIALFDYFESQGPRVQDRGPK